MGRLFVIIGGLLVLVLTLALVVPPFIDWTGYRERFEVEATRILGRPVHVNGTASARLLPFPSVTFSNVVVEGSNGEKALTMDQFSMDAELMPFLRGQILIFDMRMEKPQLFAGLDEQGRLNWALPVKTDFVGSQVRLEKLTLNNGQITLRDGMRNREQRFENINATLSADSLAGPWRMNGHMQADGQPVSVEISTSENKPDSPLRLRVRLLPDNLAVSFETDGDVSVQDGKPLYKGQFAVLTLNGDERKQAANQNAAPVPVTLDKLRLTGQFEAQNSGFNIAEFRMEQGEADAPYVINGKAQLDLGKDPHFMISADGQQVYLDGMKPDVAVQSNKPVSEQPVMSFREKVDFLQQLIERIPVPDIPGNIDLRLPAIIASGTTIRSIIIRAEPDNGAWQISQLQADLPGRTQIEAKGKLQLGQDFGFQGSFLLASRQPAGFASWLSGDMAAPALSSVPAAGFSGKISLNNDVQRVDDLEIVLGETILNGHFERMSGEKRAASSVLDIQGKALDAGTMQLLSGIFIHDGDLSGLVGENLTVNLKAGPVKFAGLEAEQLDTAFRLSGGKLDFDRLLISGLEGATLSATGSLRPFDNSVNATLDATVLADDLGPVLHRLNEAFPREPLISALSDRAIAYPELFTSTKLDLIMNAVNLFADGTNADAAKTEQAQVKPSVGKGETARTSRIKSSKTATDADNSDIAELSFSLNGQTGALILSVAGSSKGTLTGPEPMQLSLTANAKAASGEAALALLGLPVVPLGLMGEAEVNLQAQGAPVAGMKTALEISGEDGNARLDGVITVTGDELTASGRAVLKSDDLEPFLATTGYALPFGRGFGNGLPADITSDFQFGKNIVRLPNLQGKLDNETVTAKLDGSLSDQSVAQLRGEIQLERFDLIALFAAMTGLPQSEIETADGANWSKNPFGARTNLPLGLDVKVSATEAPLSENAAINDFVARLVKNDQQLQISELGGQWANGKLSGKLELNNARGSLLANGDLRLSGGDVATLYRPEGIAPLSGASDIKLGFTGSGKNMSDLVQSMAGEGALTIDKLGIAGLNPAAVADILLRSDELSDAATTQAEPKQAEAERTKLAKILSQSGQMSAAQLQATLSLAGGVIRAPALKLQNEQAVLQADLQLDLNRFTIGGSGSMEILLPVTERNDVTPQLQFAISGKVNEPQVKFDYQPMVQFLTQRGLLREQQRVEAAQALIIEKQRLKREADFYTARMAERKRVRLQAEEELRKRALEAVGSGTVLPPEQQMPQSTAPATSGANQTPATPDFKPSLDEFLQNLPETQPQ